VCSRKLLLSSYYGSSGLLPGAAVLGEMEGRKSYGLNVGLHVSLINQDCGGIRYQGRGLIAE
jgi:hypothetical protein